MNPPVKVSQNSETPNLVTLHSMHLMHGFTLVYVYIYMHIRSHFGSSTLWFLALPECSMPWYYQILGMGIVPQIVEDTWLPSDFTGMFSGG